MSENQDDIEYSVITHDIDDGSTEKVLVTKNMDEAMKRGQSEIDTGDYRKVEVKKKYSDQGRVLDIPLQVFEHQPKKPVPLAVFFIAALLCGAAAFAITMFVVKGGI